MARALGQGQRLVGREEELAMLDALLDSARAAAGRAVLIEGAAGMGKSVLLKAAAERAGDRGMQILTARALATERDFPYGIVLQLFERAVGAAGGREREQQFAGAAELVEPLFSGRYVDDDTRSTFALLHGLFWLTINLSRGTPTLLCVDDVQWADEGSLSFLRFLIPRLDELPVALLIAARPATGSSADGPLRGVWAELAESSISLAPLTVDAVGQLVRAGLRQTDAELSAVCAEVTRGNAFYVHEVLRALADEAPASTADLADRLREVGFATISRAALFRLGRLGSNSIALARALAVLGDGTPLRRAAILAELEFEDAARAAELLAAEEIVTVGRDLDFAHPLIGQSIAQELPPLRRAQMHARAARLLADEHAPASLVASHLLLAPATGDPAVVSVLRAAARQAQVRGLPEVAARKLQRALDEPPDRRARPLVLAELGVAELAAGLPTASEHLLAALERHEGAERIGVQRALARSYARRGDRLMAAQVLERALDERAWSDPDDQYVLLSDYLVHAIFEGGLRQRALARSARLTTIAPAGDTPGERALLAALAMRSAQDATDASAAVELAERAWAGGALLADQGVDGPGWLMVVWAFQLSDAFAEAQRVASAVMSETQRVGSIDAFASASYIRARAQFDLGLLVEAQADTEQALEASRSGWSRFEASAYALHAIVLVERNELDQAHAALDDAESGGAASGMEMPWLLFAKGRLQLARHEPADAFASFTAAGDWLKARLSVEHTVLPWRAFAARAAIAIGDPARARELAQPLIERGERAGLPVIHARGLRVVGMIEEGPEGVAKLRTACGLFAEAGAALEHTDALIDLGATLRRRGARVEARTPLGEALDRAVRIGAIWQAMRARDELAAAGGRPRTELRTGPAALTPSERRVAQLAAQGLSNAQIAQTLFVTPKTVEYHLRHAYQKLAISGRAGLADALPAAPPLR